MAEAPRRPRSEPETLRQQIRALLQTRPPGGEFWTVGGVAGALGLHRSTVWRALRRWATDPSSDILLRRVGAQWAVNLAHGATEAGGDPVLGPWDDPRALWHALMAAQKQLLAQQAHVAWLEDLVNRLTSAPTSAHPPVATRVATGAQSAFGANPPAGAAFEAVAGYSSARPLQSSRMPHQEIWDLLAVLDEWDDLDPVCSSPNVAPSSATRSAKRARQRADRPDPLGDTVAQCVRALADRLRARGVTVFPAKWHVKQHAVARKLLGRVSVDDLMAALEDAFRDPFWRDRVDSFSALERYLPRWQLRRRAQPGSPAVAVPSPPTDADGFDLTAFERRQLQALIDDWTERRQRADPGVAWAGFCATWQTCESVSPKVYEAAVALLRPTLSVLEEGEPGEQNPVDAGNAAALSGR